jgi:triacylglycerol esterase/lipase EstA (alpha/beta hydrolase family)
LAAAAKYTCGLQRRAPQPSLAEAEAAATAHAAERHTFAAGYQALPNIVVAIGYAAFDPSRAPNGANTAARRRRCIRTRSSSKVDLVGHSQGGMLAEYYTKLLGGAPHVHDLIALSPTSHGTTLDGLTSLAKTFPGANALVAAACAACADQQAGSAALAPVDQVDLP